MTPAGVLAMPGIASGGASGNRDEGDEYPTTMRTFTDERGRGWDVVAGRESWGSIVALFIPRADGAGGAGGAGAPDGARGAIRQAPLRASGYEQGNRELARCTEEELQELLDRSVPKETG